MNIVLNVPKKQILFSHHLHMSQDFIAILKESSDYMKVKLKTLSLNTYDETKKKHYRFVKELATDQLVNKFVAAPVEEQLLEAKDDKNIKIGSSYLIAENKKLVGYVRFNELDKFGILTLHYAVHPDLRRQGYGTKILVEVSDYAFKTITETNKIRLYIRNINKGSIKCAEKADFLRQQNLLQENPAVYIKRK